MSNATSLADQFNNFYSEKVQQIRKKIPKSNFDMKKYSTTFTRIPLFSFKPTTVAEL